MCAALFETPVVRIGKHEWRVLVVSHPTADAVIEYQWRRLPAIPGSPAGPWRHETEWPSHDHNDGQTAGLPKSVFKLYAAYKDEIRAALNERRQHGRPPGAA